MLRLIILSLSVCLLFLARQTWDGMISPVAEGERAEESAEAVENQAAIPEEEEIPPAMPETPTAEQVAALDAAERTAQACAIKRVLLQQDIRLIREERVLTKENLRESAVSAKASGAPAFWVDALSLLASDSLTRREKRDLMDKVQSLLALYRVDELAVRLFAETSGLTLDELESVAAWLPVEDIFDLPPAAPPSADGLAREAECILDVYSALRRQLESAKDKRSADEAAGALLAKLPIFNNTLSLRMTPEAEQARIFTPYGKELQELSLAVRKERIRLLEEKYYGSVLLRAVDYLLQ